MSLTARALLFDLGGTHLRCGLLDDTGAVRSMNKRRIVSVASGGTEAAIWECLVSAIFEEERRQRGALAAYAPIVLAFPGPIRNHRAIVHAPTLVGSAMSLPDLARDIEDATGRRVYLLNDVSAAAWHFSAQTIASRFMVVTVSSGIGSKLFDRDHSAQVLDAPLYAGEIGHYVVDDRPTAPVCECGGCGHLGAIASGRAIERAVRARAARGDADFRASWIGTRVADAATITNEAHVVPAALAGDAWTLDMVRECTRPLSRTLLAVVMAAGLERIFVIGGFAQALGVTYLAIVRAQIDEMSRYAIDAGPFSSLVELAAPDDETCLLGCGVFARRVVDSGVPRPLPEAPPSGGCSSLPLALQASVETA